MKTTTNIAFVLIYVVVLAGSIVRMTGSGMGCPDWPKCFGLLIPPTSEEEIRWAPETEYSEGRMVIERDTLWVATEDHLSQKGEFGTKVWKPYERHSYATFNAFHTWIEYLNRLSGALAGIPILILFILAIKSKKRTPIVLSTATLGSVLFVSWLGKLVVDGNLIPFSITIHAVSALAILAFLVMLMQYLDGSKTTISKPLRLWIIASLTIAFLHERNKEEKANLILKNTILDKVEGFKITDNRSEDLNTLKEFSTEWRKVGFVPRKVFEQISDRFTKAMDKHYDALSAQKSERSVASYQNHINRLTKGDSRGGEGGLRREQSILRDKISRLNTRIIQTEENMERFTGKGAQSIRDQAEKSIKNYKREIDEMKSKLKMLREATVD